MRTRLFFFFVARSPSLSLLRLLFIVRANQIAYLSSALRQSISTCLNFTQSFDLEIFGDSLVLDIFTDIHEDGHHLRFGVQIAHVHEVPHLGGKLNTMTPTLSVRVHSIHSSNLSLALT